AHHHGDGAIEDAAPEQLVEGTGADDRLPGTGGGLCPTKVARRALDAAEHFQPGASGDAQRVAAGGIVLAPALRDLQAAAGAPPRPVAAPGGLPGGPGPTGVPAEAAACA